MSHTPGPWVAIDLPNHEWRIKAKEGIGYYTICNVVSFDERQANSNLIAAAPEMLALLKEYDEFWLGTAPLGPSSGNVPVWTQGFWSRVRDVIEKAEGGRA